MYDHLESIALNRETAISMSMLILAVALGDMSKVTWCLDNRGTTNQIRASY